MISTVDPQARHTRKTSAQRRDGYKGHIAAEPETGLVTECALTAANRPRRADRPGQLLAGEAPGLEVLGDSGYGSGQTRAALRAAGHTQTIKPIPLQSAVPGGFTIHDFRIDTPGRHGQVPGGPRRADHQLGPGQLRPSLPALPAAPALHHRQAVAAPSACTRTRTSCAPPAAGR